MSIRKRLEKIANENPHLRVKISSLLGSGAFKKSAQKKQKNGLLYIKPFRQSPDFCGPASLKMILSYFDVEESEKKLAELSGHKKSTGVEAKGLLSAAKSLGFEGVIKDNCTFEDIRFYIKKKKIPIIIDWFDSSDGHYSVVIGIDKENIYLLDPSLGTQRALKLETFKRIWFDFPGELISKENLIPHRIIAIYPK